MHADTEEASKRMEEKDSAIKDAEAQLVNERALHEEVTQQQLKLIESLQLAIQAKDEKQGAQRNMVKTLESNTEASMRTSLGAVPAQEPPPIAGGDRGPQPTPRTDTSGDTERNPEARTNREFRDFDTVTPKKEKKSSSWFGGL